MKTSVVLVTYRRMENLKMIVDAWLSQTNDFWLCDCSKSGIKFDTSKFNYARFFPDPGNRVRHCIATLTSGDIVIKADDDIVPKPGLIDDFILWQTKLGKSIQGILGRTFHGEDYYANTKLFDAKFLIEPMKMDFVGIITCAPRDFLTMDLNGCQSAIEDLFWQMKCYRNAPKYIIPTDKYHKLPESKDVGRLCGDVESRRIRRQFYSEYYQKYYKK